MIDDDELRAHFRALARSEADGAPPFHSEEVALRRSLERRRGARQQLHPLFSSKRLATATASIIGVALVLAFGLAWGTNTGYASGLVISQHARNQFATSAIDISGQLSHLRTEIAQVRSALTTEPSRPGAQTLLDSSTSRLQQIEGALGRIESELSVTGKLDTTSDVSKSFPMKRALAVTCNALAHAQ